MAGKPKLSLEEVRQVVELYEWGLSLEELGRLFKVAGTSIWRYLHQEGVQMRPAKREGGQPKLGKELVDDIERLYLIGFSLREVAGITYVSPTCVRSYLLERGVKLRKGGGWAYNKKRISGHDMNLTIFLYERAGLSCEEIGHKLGISHSTVAHRLHRAGVKLRDKSESQVFRWQRAKERQNALNESQSVSDKGPVNSFLSAP